MGKALGFRSGLEKVTQARLAAAGVDADYEKHLIGYTPPAKSHTYKPDFVIKKNGIIVETKGRFLTADRQKHLAIKAEHPDLDIRFVFSNSNARISKKSKTTYAQWCVDNGFLYADKTIPQAWLDEAEDFPGTRMAALARAKPPEKKKRCKPSIPNTTPS